LGKKPSTREPNEWEKKTAGKRILKKLLLGLATSHLLETLEGGEGKCGGINGLKLDAEDNLTKNYSLEREKGGCRNKQPEGLRKGKIRKPESRSTMEASVQRENTPY